MRSSVRLGLRSTSRILHSTRRPLASTRTILTTRRLLRSTVSSLWASLMPLPTSSSMPSTRMLARWHSAILSCLLRLLSLLPSGLLAGMICQTVDGVPANILGRCLVSRSIATSLVFRTSRSLRVSVNTPMSRTTPPTRSDQMCRLWCKSSGTK